MSVGSARPRKRVAVDSSAESVVSSASSALAVAFGEGSGSSIDVDGLEVDVSQKKTSARTSAPVSAASQNKLVTLRNYTNIFNLIDGLKYQLPEFGRELCVPALVDLLARSADVSSSVRAHRNIADTSTINSVAFSGAPGNFDKHMLSRASWSDLTAMLLPLFTLTSSEVVTAARNSVRPAASVVAARLRTAIIVNSVFRRFDACLTRQRSDGVRQAASAAHSARDLSDEDEEDIVSMTTRIPTVAPAGQIPPVGTAAAKAIASSSSKLLRKLLTDVRQRSAQQLAEEIGPDCAAVLHSASTAVCDCCFYSPNLVVYCSMSDSAIIDVAETSQSAGSLRTWAQQQAVPTIAFDVAYMLCGRLDAMQFDKDFVLRHLPTPSDPKLTTWSSLAKTAQVGRMGFYVRLYALHCAINLLVDWLWTRQRLCHSLLFANQPIMDSPPVTLIVSRELRPLFSQEPLLPFRLSGRAHKFIIKYV